MFLVVGSGPAGVACATALLKRGHEVTMLDAGITLEADKERLVAPLRTQPREEWSREALSLLRTGTAAKTSGIPVKLAYGSDYPYRSSERELGIDRQSVGCVPSFARGGLSNAWGGSMLPYRDEDIRDWPIRAADLAEHYRAVLGWVPHSAVHDRLEELFPLYSSGERAVASSRQAVELLSSLDAHASALASRGMVCGRSRVAIDPSCIRCGLCVYGCPKHYVYNAADTLERLRENPKLTYRPGVIVERVSETGSGVNVETRALEGGGRETFQGERVFLGCGPLSTTRLLLASLEAFDREVTLRDSQYYLFPMLRDRKTADVKTEDLHTLAQVFVEILDPDVCPQSVHVQLYSYNDLYARVFDGMLGPLSRALPLGQVFGRMWIALGYLHSSVCPGIRAVLRRPTGTEAARFVLRAMEQPETAPRLKRVMKKFSESYDAFGMRPVTPMLKIGAVGQGYHVGGSFPMRTKPGPLESDVLGRPFGFERVHAVDSTTFPSVPASTIALTVMANAHRIASTVTA